MALQKKDIFLEGNIFFVFHITDTNIQAIISYLTGFFLMQGFFYLPV